MTRARGWRSTRTPPTTVKIATGRKLTIRTWLITMAEPVCSSTHQAMMIS